MVDISVDELRDSSTASLIRIMDRIEQELQKRRIAERVRLIDEFKEAFTALNDAGIQIVHCGKYDTETHYLEAWDELEFR